MIGIRRTPRVKVKFLLILFVDNLQPRTHFNFLRKHNRHLPILLNPLQTANLPHNILLVLPINTPPHTRIRTLKVKLAQLHLSLVVVVNRRKHLKLIRKVWLHVALCPYVHPTEFYHPSVLLNKLLPELCKVVTVFLCRIVHLDHPQWFATFDKIVVVGGGQSYRLGLDLCHETWVRVVMFSFLWRPEHFPGFEDLVELLFALFAVGVLVRMVLEDQTFVLFLELTISHPRINLQQIIKIFLTLQLKLTQPHINLPLVLQNTKRENKDNKENGYALTACWGFVELFLHFWVLSFFLLFLPLLLQLLFFELLLAFGFFLLAPLLLYGFLLFLFL